MRGVKMWEWPAISTAVIASAAKQSSFEHVDAAPLIVSLRSQ